MTGSNRERSGATAVMQPKRSCFIGLGFAIVIPLVSQLGGYSAGRNYRSIVPASLAFPSRYHGSGSTKANACFGDFGVITLAPFPNDEQIHFLFTDDPFIRRLLFFHWRFGGRWATPTRARGAPGTPTRARASSWPQTSSQTQRTPKFSDAGTYRHTRIESKAKPDAYCNGHTEFHAGS
jgi:hypothetical protein